METKKTDETKAAPFTSLEKRWIMYDIGNSAVTLLFTTIMPIYFNNLAEAEGVESHVYLGYWGYAIGICTLIVAILGPILGAAADSSGSKKRLFIFTVIFGALFLAALALPLSWVHFLILFVLSRTGYQASLIFYDAMLTDICSKERMDKVSSYGYALGYIGSTIPFIISLLFVLGSSRIGLSTASSMGIAILINVGWWLAFTLPLASKYKQRYAVSKERVNVIEIFRRLFQTFGELAQNRKLLLFLIAFFFYIDGVYTIIDMAVAFGDSIGLNSSSLLLALLLTQVVAFPSAIVFSIIGKKLPNHSLITVAIIGYTAITFFAVQLDKTWEFWLLAVCVGLFQGGIQAMSRSYFAQLIPPEKSGKYFGIYDIFGKGAAFMGTTIVGAVSHLTGDQHLGILAIAAIFIVGFVLFRKAVNTSES